MAEGKSVGGSGGGAGFFAKRVQKQLCRAQEKVMQKLGKAMETKDEQFEQCSQNLNKQQNDGNRLFKDIKAYFNAVKVMHETSKRLSHSLKDIYESDWHGQEDLSVIVESEDLLWNDFEEKLADQTVRTLENYTSQFPEVKERVAKRGRKLVDYDSSRHHLEALQNAKKRDEAKVAKAEEEFNKAQSVFEDINTELREELPVLFQSRIGCYVTVFQNISNLRDVFYKEMSTLNNELYNVMKKLETQHSDKAFIIKGLHSTTSKKRRSLMISAPIPCNTAFPSDHNTIPLPLQDNKGSDATSLKDHQEEVANEIDTVEGQDNTEHEEATESFESQASLDSTEEKLLASEADRNKYVSGDSDGKAGEESQKHEGREQSSEENSTQLSSQNGTSCTLALDENVESTNPQGSPQPGLEASENLDTRVCDFSQPEPSPTAAVDCQPVPTPQSLQSSVEKPVPATVTLELREERREEASDSCDSDAEDTDVATSGQTETALPPGFLYKGVAVKGNLTEETGQLQFIEGDVILVLDDEEQKPEGIVRGLKERHWIEHGQLDQSGIFMEKLIWRIESK